ncbi:Sel1 repeat-containing protein [Colwellia chukchiensis]|uniref:Sel1 repeat-containing protein n=1 Tax=Colwellia chukchiensis TaxID=641665 RepID=A0A1H7GIQ4_9GAMM|nr:tetratricopeptide repeat protein [Colwellia chukchiensis]SEK37998.1 Sel1 repeat-containing protein [Colwellia chukchiensis]
MPSIIVKSITILALVFSFNVLAVNISKCMTSECVSYFKSFKKAAHRGHKNAMFNLGKFFQYGFGTEIDNARALNFYKKAAMRGLREAEYRAGMLLLSDQQLYDFDQAEKWLKRASRKGQPNAAFLLGKNYFTRQQFSQADIWLTMVYEAHPKHTVDWLERMQNTDTFSAENLPLLHKALAASPIETFKSAGTDDENIEVITVTGMHRNSVLDSMLAGFRKRIRSTGTRLPNISCDQSVACNQKSLNEMKDSIWVSQR